MRIVLEKGDTEGKVMLAKAMLANKLVSSIEQANYEINLVYRRDDEVATAVIEVVKLFGVHTQWTAVYRVLVDFCGWEKDIARFSQRMTILLKGTRLDYQCSYQAIQKPLAKNSILRKDFRVWKQYRVPDGDRVFARQLFIAKRLLELLSINA